MNFSTDWGGKLTNNEQIFTTIREDLGYFWTGKTIEIKLKKKLIYYADVLKVERISFDDITEGLAQSDAGMSKEKLLKMLYTMYGQKILSGTFKGLILITMRKKEKP